MSASKSVDELACADAVHRRAKAGFAVLLRIKQNLPSQYALNIPDDDSFVIGALTQHGNHLSAHTIEQTHADCFMLACLLGSHLVKNLFDDPEDHQAKQVIEATIRTLDEMLYIDTNKCVQMPDKTSELLKRLMLQQHQGNDDHGIWINGLYMAYHCSIATYKQLRA